MNAEQLLANSLENHIFWHVCKLYISCLKSNTLTGNHIFLYIYDSITGL